MTALSPRGLLERVAGGTNGEIDRSELLPGIPPSFFIRRGYRHRLRPAPGSEPVGPAAAARDPLVYQLAAHLALRFRRSHVIGVGCGDGGLLAELHPKFEIVGVDTEANVEQCRQRYPFGTWIAWDFDRPGKAPIPTRDQRHAVFVCSDLLQRLNNPSHLLRNLELWMRRSPLCVMSTPERTALHGSADQGPPADPAHVREWTLDELERLLLAAGLTLEFSGLTMGRVGRAEKTAAIAILRQSERDEADDSPRERPRRGVVERLRQIGPPRRPPLKVVVPRDFHVVAIMTAYNEADIIVPSIRRLARQGVGVYLVDNWSTDGTYERASELRDRGLVGIERFPPDQPAPYYNWSDLLRRVEELGTTLDGSWFIHHDADEARCSPWPELTLAEAIYKVDQEGFNCIDHTAIYFHPVDNSYRPGGDFERRFRFFDFQTKLVHLKAWKNTGQRVDLASSAGHRVRFDDQYPAPYKFLLKHYPIRSQQHGEQKVWRDRIPRWNPEERDRGWHSQYHTYSEGQSFLRDPSTLIRWDESTFYRQFLVERISSIGVRG